MPQDMFFGAQQYPNPNIPLTYNLTCHNNKLLQLNINFSFDICLACYLTFSEPISQSDIDKNVSKEGKIIDPLKCVSLLYF